MKEFVKWEKGRYEIQWNHITPVISSGAKRSPKEQETVREKFPAVMKHSGVTGSRQLCAKSFLPL